MEKYDVVVIGAGPGGYPAAIRAAQLGASVAIVEKEMLGGTCLNWGCIPTKALIASSELYHNAIHGKDMGVTANADYDYAAMIKRKGDVVGKLKGGVEMLLKSNGVDIIKGTASFKSRNKLVIKGKGKAAAREIEVGSTIIATGSTSVMPGFIPKGKNVVESRKFLDITELPDSMLVLGGGVIGCEFACMAAMLGVKVTIVEMLDDILFMLDADVRKEIRRNMEDVLNIEILTGQPMQNIKAGKDGVTGKVGDKDVDAEMLLVSIGRAPVTDGLDLENAGITTDDRGFIEIDDYCRTKAATVYAIGDVTAGSTQLAHAATSQGVTAAENACGDYNKAETYIPACIFTSPECGTAGLTEQQAKEQGIKYKVGKYAFGGLGKAMAAGETGGFVKILADAETDQLLGAHSVGAHATELISQMAVAIRNEITAEELGSTVHCHPTFSEAWMEAGHALHGVCIHQPGKRR
ncbi:dihydrolipoyl dehydrogenase [bacterium E08(2017)]|nr:dihydrolipoyl dehydrogenase [bacterium E08(2017)]